MISSVLVKRDIAYVVQPVFNFPVTAIYAEQHCRSSLLVGQASDEPSDLCRCVPFDDSGSRDFASLFSVRKENTAFSQLCNFD